MSNPGSDLANQKEKALEVKFLEGFAFHQRGTLDRARELYQQVLELDPRHFDALHMLGVVALQTNEPNRALEWINLAIEINPNVADAYANRSNALLVLRRHEDARESCDKAIALNPDFAVAHYNRGIALKELKRYDAALESYDRAIALKPDYAEAHNNRGNALRELKRYDAALQSYGKAIALKPDDDFLYGAWLHTRLLVCDWKDADEAFVRLAETIGRDERSSTPFPVLGISSSPATLRKVAETFARKMHPGVVLPQTAPLPKHDKIRIGYFSADFHNHATAHLIAELFERHDKSKVEVTAFSFGPNTDDEMRKRLSAAANNFIDVHAQSDSDVAKIARKREIDIAIDLKGFTQNCRPGIFALRAAPIQVNYLGYPGTMGADYIDYLVADTTLIPEADRRHYAEKIVYLPDSYQVNDSKRRISDRIFTREELGLPPAGFVFCCFNNNFKILPDTFDSWMRILSQVEGSVLWLFQDNETAARNLRQEAVARGVAADRLIFARHMPLADHLARHRLADLFLDTLPYNAHTTASDALWAGLPVLTRIGETFAGRVAASLLRAIGLPELITATQEEYERLAIALATDPGRLAQLKHKLERNRLKTPLFDAALFTRHIEAAYMMMYERHHAGLPPAHLWPA